MNGEEILKTVRKKNVERHFGLTEAFVNEKHVVMHIKGFTVNILRENIFV